MEPGQNAVLQTFASNKSFKVRFSFFGQKNCSFVDPTVAEGIFDFVEPSKVGGAQNLAAQGSMAEELNQKKHERLKQLRVLRQDASDGVLEEKHAFSFSFWRCCNDVFMFLSYLFWEDSFPNYSRENVFKKCHFSTWVITMFKVCQNIQPFWLLPNL